MGKAFPEVKFSLVFTSKESLTLVVKTMTKVAARGCVCFIELRAVLEFFSVETIHS